MTGLLDASSIFFTDGGIMYEVACEPVKTVGTCDTDQQSKDNFVETALQS